MLKKKFFRLAICCHSCSEQFSHYGAHCFLFFFIKNLFSFDLILPPLLQKFSLLKETLQVEVQNKAAIGASRYSAMVDDQFVL